MLHQAEDKWRESAYETEGCRFEPYRVHSELTGVYVSQSNGTNSCRREVRQRSALKSPVQRQLTGARKPQR